MANDESLARLERVKQVATLAGLKGDVNPEKMHYQMSFSLPEDRRQMVFVRDTSVKTREVVTVFSVCMVVKKTPTSGLSKETALELLVANQKLHFARYGIWDSEDETTILASCDYRLETLDPAEFNDAAWGVAYAADRFERAHGQDKF